MNEELEKQYKLKQLRKELSSLFKVRMPYKIENDELNFGLNHLISLHDTTIALVENETKQKKIEAEIKILIPNFLLLKMIMRDFRASYRVLLLKTKKY